MHHERHLLHWLTAALFSASCISLLGDLHSFIFVIICLSVAVLFVFSQEVQKAASLFFMYSDLFCMIPSLLVTLVLVAYSDQRGRKITIILPLIGSLVYCLSFLAVSIFELNLYLLIAGAILSSLFGGIGTILGGCFSYVADLFEDGKQKMLRMAGLDMMLGLLSGVALISTGYFMHAVGFNWPFFTAAMFHLINLVYAVFILQESREIDSMAYAETNTCTLSKLTLGIYSLFARGSRRRNWLLVLLIIIFCSFSFVYFGGLSLITLYELKEPLCWNEILIGYGAALSTAVFVVSFVGIYVLSRCLSDTTIIFIGMLSVFIGLVMMAFTKTTLLMFLGKLSNEFITVSAYDYTHSNGDIKKYIFLIKYVLMWQTNLSKKVRIQSELYCIFFVSRFV